jgi:signal transduction histidine kinase
MPDRRKPYGRPPWWPEGERWQGPGSAWRGRLFPLVLIGLLVILGFGFLLGSAFHRPWLLWPLGLVAFLAFARFGRPRYFPVGKLVDAAGKLAAGDYSVRVPEVEGGPMRQVVRSFNGMADRLEHSSEQRRRLLADLGHELRTPLTVIQGELEAMADGVHAVDQAQLEMLLDETRLLGRLVDDLRVLSLSEAGELRLEKETLDAGALLEDAIAPYLASAARAGVDIRMAADPGILTGDPFRLREVLANLITNAIRHTPTRGIVQISVTKSASGWTFSVRDTGSGIPSDALPHIFDRFVKGGDSRGTGLGLSIARDLVRAHDGEMTVSSEEGRGTTIVFTVPQQKI